MEVPDAALPRFLFDFDGTLADSYAAITASVNHVLEHYDRPTLTEEKVRSLVGHGLEQLLDTILPGVDHDEAAKLYRAHHPTVMNALTRLLPGVLDGLERLHAAGIKMGVCSNKPSKFTRELVVAFGLDQYLTVVVGPDDAGTIKPDPTMVFMALEKLGISKDNALYVGDMEVDIETGRRADIETWVMPTGSNDEATLRAAGYGRVFPAMNEVIADVMNEN